MIIKLLNTKNKLWWLIFHIILGIVATISNTYIIIWFYFILVGTFYLIGFEKINRPLIIASSLAYLGAFELIARMTKCSPIIPWESGKYTFFLLTIIGILISPHSSAKKYIGASVIFLVIPSILIDRSGMATLNDVIFNILGIINIGLGIIFFNTLKISQERFYDLIRLIVFPCITILTYTFIKTPDFQDITFSLGAQTATSGQFGSNQVSTVLGLGFLLMIVSWILNWKITGSKTFDGILAIMFLIQGLITFSRGGMIGGGIGFIIFIYFLFQKSERRYSVSPSIKLYIIPLMVIFVVALKYANDLTEGNLLLRYQGETHGTLKGTRDKDLTTITSGRNIIFLSDLELWKENPIWGSGAGASKYLRSEDKGVAAHIELSRILAEHGSLGLIIFLLILYSGVSYFKENITIIKALKLSLFTLAIFSTFHSATRTFVTPLLLSLCTINVKNEVVKK